MNTTSPPSYENKPIKTDRGLLLAWLIRVFVILIFSDPYHSDATGQYIPMAMNLFSGHGFSLAAHAPYLPTAGRMPGYPFFLSIFYCPWPEYPQIAIFVQTILEGLGIFLLYRLTLQLTENRRTAQVAALLAIIYPFSLLTTGTFLRVATVSFFIMAGFYFVMRAIQLEKLWQLAMGACFLSVSSYFEEQGVYYVILFAVYWFLRHWKNRRLALQGVAVLVILQMVILAPWIMRNAVQFQKFIPLNSFAFGHLWVLGNVDTDGVEKPSILSLVKIDGPQKSRWDFLHGRYVLARIDAADAEQVRITTKKHHKNWREYASPVVDFQVNQEMNVLVKKYLKAYPMSYALLVAQRFFRFAFSSRAPDFPGNISSAVLKMTFVMFHILLICGGLAGLLLRRSTAFLAVIALFSFLAIAILGQPYHRYTLPALPILFLGLALLWERLAASKFSAET